MRVTADSGAWAATADSRATPRSSCRLARAGATGRSAADLSEDLFADAGRLVTVRAEMSRLRKDLGSLLHSKPYRLAPGVAVRLRLPTDRAAVLPGSSAPVVAGLRRDADEMNGFD